MAYSTDFVYAIETNTQLHREREGKR